MFVRDKLLTSNALKKKNKKWAIPSDQLVVNNVNPRDFEWKSGVLKHAALEPIC